MVRILADFFTRLVRKYLPDAFLFAVILTFFVFLLGMIVEGKTAIEMVSFWGDKYWSLLAFAMQMVLVLSTGHTLAKTNFVGNILSSISGMAKTPAQAIVIVTLVASTACWINSYLN